MAVPQLNGRPLKEVFSKSKKEIEADIGRDTLDFWPGMEVSLDQDDTAFSGDWTPIVYEQTSTITPSEDETTIKSLEKEPKRSVEKAAVLKPVETERTPKPFDEKVAFRPVIPFDNPSRPSVKWPPFERFPIMRPFEPLAPPIKPMHKWELEDMHVNWNRDSSKYEFVFEHPTPPPVTSATHTGVVILKVIWWFFLALLVISKLNKKNKTRKGVALAAGGAAEQEMLTDRRPSDAEAPLKTELPPQYYECAPYVNKCIGEVPPPYTHPEHGASRDHKRLDVSIKNELYACSESGAPDMKTELVLDNGRVAERLSLDQNTNKNASGTVGNDNVEEQSTGHGDMKDRVVYQNETGHVNGKTQ